MIVLSSIIPSHDIAAWILQIISRALAAVGLPESPVLEQVVYVVVISALALAVGYLLRKVVLLVSGKVISMRASEFAQELLRQQVIQRCSHIVPPIVILALLPFAFEGDSRMLQVVTHLVVVYLLVMFGVGMNSVIGFVYANYNRRANKDNHPLKGVMGVAKGVLWIIIVILCAAELMQKSPVVLLGGLGAFAAVLMLIFKDSILGFVAGIQLSGNDMLRVGDWIVVPSTIANGVVEDVTLTVVKVRNWDNTLVMLPAYSLVASPFQNWRGMSDSGVRQIDRQVLIDTTSILPLDEALIASVVAKYS
ncbi:MAG: mechanosensitive ion channel, partial [Muribaculaceae bacterium]|nr:mechanosensitive ion channel [Muribaculaceae bacterium]